MTKLTSNFTNLNLNNIPMDQRSLHSYLLDTTYQLSLEDLFGGFEELGQIKRTEQLKTVWKLITCKNEDTPKSKEPVYYFQASPGMGKTFFFRELIKRNMNDIPKDLQKDSQKVVFWVLDFNRNSCESTTRSNSETIKKHSNLFVLARLFYVQCIDQKTLEWTNFVTEFLVKSIETGQKIELYDFMKETLLKKKIKEQITVILVDEISKTNSIGNDFAAGCRTAICSWVDEAFCSVVIFSCLFQSFLKAEIDASTRPMIPIIQLPLFTIKQSQELFGKYEGSFLDSAGIEQDKNEALLQLAMVSGGHPRSIEYLLKACKINKDPAQTSTLNAILQNARTTLRYAYNCPDEILPFFQAVLLAKPVRKNHRLGKNGPSFENLVAHGVLIDTFDNETTMIPQTSELFLNWWVSVQSSDLDENFRKLLIQLLNLRDCFTAVKFEILHATWELMIRYLRTDNDHGCIPLNELYNITRDNHNNKRGGEILWNSILEIPVNGKAILKYVAYVKASTIVLSANTMYYSTDTLQPGWDRLMVLEAFPRKDSNKRYLLPVFIQNKFSHNDSTMKLSSQVVETAHQNCKKFLKHNVSSIQSGWKKIPKKSKWFHFGSSSDSFESNFVLLFVSKCDKNANTVQNAPTNVLFCFGQELETLYGPTLSGFVKFLVPDQSLYLSPKHN